jgi:hypothetical protein
MRKHIAILAAAAAALISASALAQTYSPGQQGVVGNVVAATCTNGLPCQIILPTIQSGGVSSSLDITSSKLVVAGYHRVASVCVITAGSTAGTVNDSATTGGAATSNEVYPIPNTLGCVKLDWPVSSGIVVIPGTGQAVSVSYN